MNGTIALESNLGLKKCKSHKKGDVPLKSGVVKGYLSQLSGWKLSGKEIVKVFEFKNFYETIGFVNALAYIANREDHHPDLSVGYNYCHVVFSTHSIGGLSENDFICAAKLDRL